MKETFEDYLQRLKDRRTEDNYKYTDEDFIKYQLYITDCWLTNLSVYKCLEFMWFQTEEAEISLKNKQNQLFNRESKQETTLEEAIDENKKNLYYYKQVMNPYPVEEYSHTAYEKGFIEGYQESTKWQQEQHNFLPGFIKQFDPNEGEIEGWAAVEFLKWLDLNKFKIIK